jgi:putative intracellular protease/amidase
MAGLPCGRSVVLLAFPGVQALDLVGPMEVFTGASSIVAEAYEVQASARQPSTSEKTMTGHAFTVRTTTTTTTTAARAPRRGGNPR